MQSAPDLIGAWANLDPNLKIHPMDEAVISRVDHDFKLDCLPGCYMGPLQTARVVLLYLSPGLADFDFQEAKSQAGRERYQRQRSGTAPLPNRQENEMAWQWWTSRTRCFGDEELLRDKIAILNISAYHSKTFADAPLLAALPSSRLVLDWAQGVLFPEAIEGHRVVVCLRAARFWGIREGEKYGSLFAPLVNRGGYILKSDPLREKVVQAVKTAIAT